MLLESFTARTILSWQIAIDPRPEKVGHKIRDAQLDLIPYMLIVGPEEAANNTVALRDRIAGDLGTMSIPDAIARLSDEITQRVIRQVVEPVSEVVPEETTAHNEY